MRGRDFLLTFLGCMTLAGCGSGNSGPLGVAFIDNGQNLFASGVRLSPGGQTVRAATSTGLVSLDEKGEIVPALADRWIVADEGRSYIFRLRDGKWPDGTDLTGERARDSLRQVIRSLRGTSLGLDLAPISDVRAMAGRVVEIRLSTPMPDFLRLLAQPELALSHGGDATGEMILKRSGDKGGQGDLTFKPPEERGLPEDEEWRDRVRPLALTALNFDQALEAFEDGTVDVVLGGRIGGWPRAEPGPLSRGTRRIDPAIGLFGLQVRNANGFLGRQENREALAMALDRPALLAAFNISGWIPTTRIVPLAFAAPGATERWAGIDIDDLRGAARRRVAGWVGGIGNGETPVLRIALANEPGNAALFNEIASQWKEIGVVLERTEPGKPADLELVDQVARYAEARWFLNQFNCTLRRGLCSSDADGEVAMALVAETAEDRGAALARAEAKLTAVDAYIPIAMPLRWSLVRGDVTGYAANQWAWHPLPPLATIPK
ncbi:peptide ABC transporter substrate-binding protein [Altererythrobacter salegens]|uniref:Peptide ABC transporter substrate-binding protein n=1 Tax=Croceibacterium salegens TaxID=1737568 RepID=A0A6I4SZ42_9SPHN|nr:ABC transporter substrate-binding protein [Croceibacterium salegens]MXO61103.1 peptide ABC transporter substrate-binding protein [Croceibacterium salegens]